MNTPGSTDRPDLTVVLITLNEERNLRACLHSLPRGAEIVVLDSGSTDRTRKIATEFGARVETRPFTDYADQKNAAVALATRSWILSVDADEFLDEELRKSILEVVHPGSRRPEIGFRVRRHLVFMGRHMRFGKTKDRPLRLFRRGGGRFESRIHEKLVVAPGATGILAGRLAHRSYEDVSDYFERFNLYTSRIAEDRFAKRGMVPPGPWHVLRPWGEFLTRYFLMLGFLDGYPGYCYAMFSSFYSYVKSVKLRERIVEKDVQERAVPGAFEASPLPTPGSRTEDPRI
jgi:glycosyltransferase involved in cell wall biosynthesis